MSVRTIVLFGALAWVSGSLLVLMNRGVLAEGRVAGVSTAAAVAKVPTGDAIVSLTNDKTLYLRRGDRVWRIADPVTLQMLAKQVSAREGRSSLDGLEPQGTVTQASWSNVLGPIRPVEPVDDGEEDPVPVAGPIRLVVDPATPPAATLLDGTQQNPVLAIRIQSLSGLPVQVTSLTLTQEYARFSTTSTSTLPTSTVFDGATVWDGATRHGSRGVFGANLRATIDLSANPIVVAPLTTKVVTIKADLPANAPVQLGDYGVRLAVAAAADITQTGGSSMGARFSLRGNLFSWVDGSSSIASAWVDGASVGGYFNQPGTTTAANLNVGSLGSRLFRFSLTDTNSLESMVVRQVIVRLSGTVQDGDLVNFRLVPGQTEFPFATATAAVNGVVTFNLPQPYINLPGTNVTFNVYADVASGAGRWLRASLVEPSDLTITGGTSGAAIYPAIFLPVSSPFGYWVIGGQQGSLSISGQHVFPDTVSSVILAGSENRQIHRLELTPYTDQGSLSLHRLTLQLQGSVGGSANLPGYANVASVSLYHDGVLLATATPSNAGTTTADAVFVFPQAVAMPAWAPYHLDVAVDLFGSGTGADATQVMVRVKSNSVQDIEVRGPTGVLPSQYVNIGQYGSPSAWFLVHDAVPTAASLPLINHVQGVTDEIARFEVRNYGQVPLTLQSLLVNLASTGLLMSTSSSSTYDQVRDFRLYDDAGTAIAFAPGGVRLSATTTNGTVSFSSSTSINGGWQANATIPATFGGSYGSRTFSLRADTVGIRNVPMPTLRTVQATVPGMTGYAMGNSSYEPNWADGGAVYRYVPAGYTQQRGPFSASDSYPVLGTVVSYN